MTVTLRPHQVTAIADVDAHKGKNVLCVLPTGAGKSITLAEYARRAYVSGKVCVIFAHRDVLISQLSEALCITGVNHTFICSDRARRDITNNNLQLFGNSFYDERSSIIVSSNPTFAARLRGRKLNTDFLNSVDLWLQDEAHHLTSDSVLWGSCVNSLPNSVGIGFTATPIRGDKKGLGRHTDGVFDELSCTTTMFELINKGMLSPYKIFTPPSDVDLSTVKVTAGGDYNQNQLSVVMDKREIHGNAIEHYKRLLNGQRVITFGVTIEHCKHIAKEFNNAGIPSSVISSNTPLSERTVLMKDFKNGLLLNLVNVNMIGEGYDCPSVAGVIMLRPTQSYSLFKQMFGRCLRPSEGKSHGILLDHVGNTQYMMNRFGLVQPHDDPHWTLDRQSKRKKSDDGKKLDKTAICPECAAFYVIPEGGERICPDCGHNETIEESEVRIRDLQVKEGHLVEMSIDIVDNIIRERAKIDLPVETFAKKMQNAPSIVRHSAINNHTKRFNSQIVLRDKIQKWCLNQQRVTGFNINTVQGEFSRMHGINIFKAQTLGEREAMELTKRIKLS